jgi:hypothetical protein
MPYTTDIQRGGIIDIISSNTISTTPVQSESDSMYIVGEDKAFITVQRDKSKKVSAVFIVKHKKTGRYFFQKRTEHINIKEPEYASLIYKACELKLAAQKREAQKLATISPLNKRYR